MRDETYIKRIKLDHYGPLGDIDLELDEGLNVFYGRNESGKTLIVEAIAKMLLDDYSAFKDIDRVSQEPSGMLLMEKEGREIEISQESIPTIFEDITASDIINSFLIRDFDLRLPERENDFGKGSYFNDVTDRVLGSKTNKIQGIRDEIADLSYLTNSTPDSRIENRKATGNLRIKKEDAEKLREEVNSLIKEIKDEGLVEKYSRIESLQKQIEDDKKRIKQLEKARKKQKYEKGKKIISDVRDIEEQLEKLEEETEEIEEAREIKRRAESFEPVEFSGYEIFWKGSVAGMAITALSLIATILTSSLIPIGFALFSFIFSIYTGQRYLSIKKQVEDTKTEREEILKEARAKGLASENLQDIKERFKSWKSEVDRRKTDLKEKRGELAGTFLAEFDTDAEDLEKWEEVVEEYYKQVESTDVEYRELEMDSVKEDLNEKQKKLEQVEEDISQYDDRFSDVNSRLADIIRQEFIEEEPVDIEVFEDLESAERQLQAFVENVKNMRDSSHKALEILIEMEEEEEDEFNRIFADESYAVEMFREATDGNYTDINYDKDERVLKVKRKDGTVLTPDRLSQGTYDLLYMAVRVKLAREIMGEPGFLILDSAFVHSDADRVKKELEFLQKLEYEGWQIIYFTFRDDVRDQLEELTEVRELENLSFE